MKSSLSRLSEWLASHPWVIVSGVCGVAVGILLSLPILHVEFPDGVSSILGAAVGSFLAVGSAAWLSSANERRERSESRNLALQVFAPLRAAYKDVLSAFYRFENKTSTAGSAPVGRTVVLAKFSIVQSKAGALNKRLPNLRDVFAALGPIGHLAFADAERVTAETMHDLAAWFGNAIDQLESEPSEKHLLKFLAQYMFLEQTVDMIASGKRPSSGSAYIPDFMLADNRFKVASEKGGV